MAYNVQVGPWLLNSSSPVKALHTIIKGVLRQRLSRNSVHFWDDDRFGCISSQDDQGLSHLLRGSRHLCPPQFPEAQHSCYATCAAMPVLHLVDLTFRFQKLNWRAWALQRWKMKQVGTCWSDNASFKIFWNGKRFLDPRERLMRKVKKLSVKRY